MNNMNQCKAQYKRELEIVDQK